MVTLAGVLIISNLSSEAVAFVASVGDWQNITATQVDPLLKHGWRKRRVMRRGKRKERKRRGGGKATLKFTTRPIFTLDSSF